MNPRTWESPGRGSPGQSPASSAAYHNDMLSVARATPTDDGATRCRECERILTAERSVTRGVGPKCADKLARVIAQATRRRVSVLVLAGNLVARLGEVAP